MAQTKIKFEAMDSGAVLTIDGKKRAYGHRREAREAIESVFSLALAQLAYGENKSAEITFEVKLLPEEK